MYLPSRVVSFGCSLTWGAELADADPINNIPSKNSYAGLIAQRFNKDYLCLAIPGSGNDTIERIVTEYLRDQQRPGDFVIIGWSSATRREYPVKSNLQSVILGLKSNQKHQKAHDEIILNADYSLIEYQTQLILLRTQWLLKSFGLPYVMLRAIGGYNVDHLDFLKVPEFYPWYSDNGFAVSSDSHPLEQAHAAYADLIFPQVWQKLVDFQK